MIWRGRADHRSIKDSGGDRARIALVDQLRGFALFGILVVNVWFFHDPHAYAGTLDPDPEPARSVIGWVVAAVFESKFYLLFGFLFGVSFHLMLRAAAAAGRSAGPPLLRRMVGLMALGLLHGLLLFPGDILVTYGLVGLVLVAMRWASSRVLLVVAAVIPVSMTVVLTALGLVVVGLGDDAGSAINTASADATLAGYTGGALEVLRSNLAGYPDILTLVLVYQGPMALAAAATGIVVARVGTLQDPAAVVSWWRRRAGWLLPVGVLGALGYAWGVQQPRTAIVALALTTITGPALTSCYAAAVAAGSARDAPAAWRWLSIRMASAGRLALSNYLFQSLAMSVIFTGYGLGLMGKLPAGATVLVVLAVYLLGLLLSHWWLRRHRYGPAEWLLRWWTRAEWRGAVHQDRGPHRR